MKPEQGENRTARLNKPLKQRGRSDKGTAAESSGTQHVTNAPLPSLRAVGRSASLMHCFRVPVAWAGAAAAGWALRAQTNLDGTPQGGNNMRVAFFTENQLNAVGQAPASRRYFRSIYLKGEAHHDI